MKPPQPPNLDDRTVQQIIDQLMALAEREVPDWRPPTEGDAGTMLQTIFAYYSDVIAERLNQVPQKNKLAFLDLMGISLMPPSPASVAVSFTLIEGSPSTTVPRDSVVSAIAANGEEVLFETVGDLVVIPAQLSAGLTMDPHWDRYTFERFIRDEEDAVDEDDEAPAVIENELLDAYASEGFTPFVGTQPMPHVLYLGGQMLLAFSQATVSLYVSWLPEDLSIDALREFLMQQLQWQYAHDGTTLTADPVVPVETTQLTAAAELGAVSLTLASIEGLAVGDQLRLVPQQGAMVVETVAIAEFDEASPNTVFIDPPVETAYASGTTAELVNPPVIRFVDLLSFDETVVQGVSESGAVEAGLTNHWLWATLIAPIEDVYLPTAACLDGVPVSQLLLDALALNVKGGPLMPQEAFYNEELLDTSKPFYPLGEDPKRLDTFYFSSPEAMAKPNSALRLMVELDPPPDPKLQWLYWDTSWVDLLKHAPADDCKGTFAEAYQIMDCTHNFTQSGDIVISYDSSMAPRLINNVCAQWFYTHLVEGNYAHGAPLVTMTLDDADVTLVGFFGQKPINFEEPFFPLGQQPGLENFLFLGLACDPSACLPADGEAQPRENATVQELRIHIEVIDFVPPNVTLQWEYHGQGGWQVFDPQPEKGPGNFTESGYIRLPETAYAPAIVNDGEASYWIRAILTEGNYGSTQTYDPVDPADPSLGFQLKPDSGNLNPPLLASLQVDYDSTGEPQTVTQNGFFYIEQSARPLEALGFHPFIPVSQQPVGAYEDDVASFYLGFEGLEGSMPVTLYVAVAPTSAGRVIKDSLKEPSAAPTRHAPLEWEYFNGSDWQRLVVLDLTKDLTQSGFITFLTPRDISLFQKHDLTPRYWIRARSESNDPVDTQHLLGIYLNTVEALQQITIHNELLGSSNGGLDQSFELNQTPVLPGAEIYVRESELPLHAMNDPSADAAEATTGRILRLPNPATGESEIWVRWRQADNFVLSGPKSRTYLLEPMTGKVTFGDGVNGMIPPVGSDNILALKYRSGGGVVGNVPSHSVTQLQSPVENIDLVDNPQPADNGADTETLEMVLVRGPQSLKNRDRAVTCGDYVWLAKQAAGTRVARAQCLSNINRALHLEPGWITLIIVPQANLMPGISDVAEPVADVIEEDHVNHSMRLEPSPQLIRRVQTYLDQRNFIGISQPTPSRLYVIGPGYLEVTVYAEVVPTDFNLANEVDLRAYLALREFFDPLHGGNHGTGWPFGRNVYKSEVEKVLQGVRGVDFVKAVRIKGNVAQNRLVFERPLKFETPLNEGTTAISANRLKAALLAEPISRGELQQRVPVKGFQEGEQIAHVVDLIVTGVSDDVIQVEPTFTVSGLPESAEVKTFDGLRKTRLKRGVEPDQSFDALVVDDPAFAGGLQPGDWITVFYPFPMTVTSVEQGEYAFEVRAFSAEARTITVRPLGENRWAMLQKGDLVSLPRTRAHTLLESSAGIDSTNEVKLEVQSPSFIESLNPGDIVYISTAQQKLGIEPYASFYGFAEGSVVASLDNRIRLPLSLPVLAHDVVEHLNLEDFEPQDVVSIHPWDQPQAAVTGRLMWSALMDDIVYLDDNFLIYLGPDQIYTVADEARPLQIQEAP